MMPKAVEGDVFIDIADGDDFLDVVVHLLVANHREHKVILALTGIFLHYHQRNIEQRYGDRSLCLLPLLDYPQPPVCLLDYLLECKLLDVDVCQPGIAGEDKEVANRLQLSIAE